MCVLLIVIVLLVILFSFIVLDTPVNILPANFFEVFFIINSFVFLPFAIIGLWVTAKKSMLEWQKWEEEYQIRLQEEKQDLFNAQMDKYFAEKENNK